MSDRDKEYWAFRDAKLSPKPEKRQAAIGKITRKGLLIRLVKEADYPDSRVNAMKRLNALPVGKVTDDERAFYLKLALKESVTEIRRIAAKRVVDGKDSDKLTGSAYADVRLMLAQITSSRDVLMVLLVDKDASVAAMAEKGLRKNGLQESTRPHSVN